MKLSASPTDVRWWFSVVGIALIVAALAGWTPGYLVTPVCAAFVIVFFLIQYKSPAEWPVQVRLVWFALSLFGLWPAVRAIVYALLLVGLVMATFFGHCSITMMLKRMPWNQSRPVHLY
jgi:hypothetical protein